MATSKERDGELTPRGGNAGARTSHNLEGLKSSDKTSDHSSNHSGAEAKIIQDEMKTKNDAKSCKFCHVVPPRKKVKYPNQIPNNSYQGRMNG